MSTVDGAAFAELAGYAERPAAGLASWSAADADREWRFDFHFPHGALPLSTELVDTAMRRASQAAAAQIHGLSSGGLESRIAGIYIYTAGVPAPVVPERGLDERLRLARDYVAGFDAEWGRRSDDLLSELQPVETRRLTDLDDHALASTYAEAKTVFSRAWELHFDVMYRLLSVHTVFEDLCDEVGVDSTRVLNAVPPRPSKISDATDALFRLAERAAAELSDLFATSSGPDLMRRLDASRAGRAWLADFAGVLVEFGRRSDSVIDVGAAAWAERPSKPLALVENFVAGRSAAPVRPPWHPAALHRLAEGLRPAAARRFAEALDLIERANFAWWNEEHNYYIDLRAHLPVRRVGLEVGRRFFGEPRPGLMLFEPELFALCDGSLSATDLSEVVAAREALYADCQGRRFQMPGVVGGRPVDDLILGHIFGSPSRRELDAPTIASCPAVSRGTVLTGLGVVAGVVRGRARHVTEPDQITSLSAGEVLVCRGTTPAWSDELRRAGACVSESGGLLSHVAIECRARGLIGVVGVQRASQIPGGALIEVDGTRGTVTLL